MKTELSIKAEGHVVIRDLDTREVLVDQHNDIHIKNFGEALALALAGRSNGFIEEMHFGSGGSIVNSTGSIDYLAPNVSDAQDQADLHGAGGITYFKVVNNNSSRFNSDPNTTNIKIIPNALNPYTDIVITCTLGYGEPEGQAAFDNGTVNAPFVFDELCLKTLDPITNKKRMLTHVIFHPVQKALNRSIEVEYTVRITMVA
jgi:hypothetical protein